MPFLFFLFVFLPIICQKGLQFYSIYFQVPLISFTFLISLYFILFPSNIIKSPNDEKYRRVKTQNKSFSSKVWCLPEAQQFLHHWGWTEVCHRKCYILMAGSPSCLNQASGSELLSVPLCRQDKIRLSVAFF